MSESSDRSGPKRRATESGHLIGSPMSPGSNTGFFSSFSAGKASGMFESQERGGLDILKFQFVVLYRH